MYRPLFVGVRCWSLFWHVLRYVLSSFAIMLTRIRELVVLLLLSFVCLVTVNVPGLFLTVPWVGLQFVIVVFPDHTHLLFKARDFNATGLSTYHFPALTSIIFLVSCLL